jgi:phosphate transport system ATP-binding protein
MNRPASETAAPSLLAVLLAGKRAIVQVAPVPPPEPQPAIRVRNLSVSYAGKPAIRDVTLTINKNSITAIAGPSGCGKTSFLSSLNRLTDLIPCCRITGEICLGDQPIFPNPIDLIALRRRVGMIFQRPNPFPLSIRKNITFPLREHGIRNRDAQHHILQQSFSDVGLWDEVKDRLDAPALALSGGQQQRLCLARALALQPEVLLLDEPCSSLDPISSGIVEDLIVSLRHRYTIIIVTHNLPQARRIADQVAFFWMSNDAGYLVESGPTHQVFESPRQPLTAAYVAGTRG